MTLLPAALTGWQPIKTAPKSPDWVLGLFADRDIRKCAGDKRYWFDWDGNPIDAPTHWMPLPAALTTDDSALRSGWR